MLFTTPALQFVRKSIRYSCRPQCMCNGRNKSEIFFDSLDRIERLPEDVGEEYPTRRYGDSRFLLRKG